MAKSFAFSAQPASEDCPAVPRPVRVFGESLKDATEKLRTALKADPRLELPHPEFDTPTDQRPKRSPPKKS